MNSAATHARKGFTLLEVLVSTAIMVVIVLTVVTIASDSLRVYDRAVADLSTQSEARGVLDAMENDFSSAVLRSDGRCWMEILIPGGAGSPINANDAIGNIHPVDQPIVMLFSSPQDRPRWSADVPRRQLRGEVCAVAYRIGQRSPFDMPGDPIQRVYGVYRTIIDPENTFAEAFPVIMDGPVGPAMRTPWDYWSAPRKILEYAPLAGNPGPRTTSGPLIDMTPNCWTMDDQNFIGSNVVSMNLILWCSSSLPAPIPRLPNSVITDPVARHDTTLRPVFPATTSQTLKYATNAALSGGYGLAFRSNPTPSTNVQSAPLRYAELAAPVAVATNTTHPKDYYFGRLRVFSNRMYPDTLPLGAPATARPFNYMPYTVRGVEVSITVLTPEGSKELRGLQDLRQVAKFTSPADLQAFNRIVFQHGRNYTRYIRVLGNGN
ncbi:MAG: prepilin-type N-terminal cleavage/methylation domain-containing protein [Verrucomicrobia bacterium]|nr:prepilin-type N-terminal cleavage/methylation domain-containing protein [Verrucomicrobiota bacterium]